MMMTPMKTALMNDWDAIIPGIFSDTRFHQTGRARYQIKIDGGRAGIAVAWRSANFENHALNVSDFETLLELKRTNQFDFAFVVAATRNNRFAQTYVAHSDAEKLSLTSMPLNGPFGPFWLLSQFDFGNRANVDAQQRPKRAKRCFAPFSFPA
jgi:hypothetical protein